MIRFSKYIWLYALISLFVLVPGVYSLVRYGFRQSIDFAGGSLVEYRTSAGVTTAAVQDAAKDAGIDIVSLQKSGNQAFIVRMKQEPQEKLFLLTQGIEQRASVSA
ncbi:MAG: hypothetical protein AAB960_01150, partial [Patescibacteria group bacterium]